MALGLYSKYLTTFFIFFSLNAQAREIYSYDKSVSIFENEQRFLKNLRRHCGDYGIRQVDDLLTPSEYLETFPKDIAFHFFKKNLKEICYYGVSITLKYLGSYLKQETEELAHKVVDDCLSSKSSFMACGHFDRTATLFDMTIILGHFCSSESLKRFKAINCHYKELKQRECRLYLDEGHPEEECPYYFPSKVEVQQLHKNYFHSNCQKKWRPPSCIL